MERLDGKTFDVVQDNIEKLKQLFPELFTDNKINFDKLRLALGEHVETDKERYEFTWSGKTEAIQLAQKQTTGTLRPCKESSVNWLATQNLYIEGDNLEVLRILQHSYRNKIKMIYIDPPYNTGKDFVYQDDFHDNVKNYKEKNLEGTKSNPEINGRFHTDWLNMMYPRLKLARNVLKEDGVIFISINDKEYSNLKKICDEIYGEHNYVQTLKWKRKKQPSYLHGHVASVMEYILIYAKNIKKLEKLSIEGRSDSNTRVDNKSNALSKRFIKKGVRVKLPEDVKVIKAGVYQNKTMATEYLEDVHIENGRTTNDFYAMAQFRNDQAGLDKFVEEDVLFITKNYGFRRDLLQEEQEKRKAIVDLLLDWGDNQDSDNEISAIFPEGKPFDYPKPVKLISNLIRSVNTEGEIILDFFSGSGTTAQAALELNEKRRFILVQLPEDLNENLKSADSASKQTILNAIAVTQKLNVPAKITEVAKERIRRVGQSLASEDVGFKVFRLDDTNLKVWDEQSSDLEKDLMDLIDPVKENRSSEDVVYEILIKYGIDLTVPIEEITIAGKQVFSVGTGYLLICLERDLTLEQIEEMAMKKPARIVFYDEGFKDDTVRTNAEQTLKRYGVEDIRVI